MGVMCRTFFVALSLYGCGQPEPFREEQQLGAVLVNMPGSGEVSGSADVFWIEGTRGFRADIRLGGALPGAPTAWHVHFGTCGTAAGAIVGSEGDYPVLVPGTNGTVVESVDVPAPLTVIEQYYVDVHAGGTALDPIVACGDLVTEPEETSRVHGLPFGRGPG